MPLDPMTMMMLATTALSAAGVGGKPGEFGSTYTEKQRSKIDQILDDLKGMKGAQDITQNPSYQQGQEWLNALFNDPEFFRNIEAPLQRQFQEETIPGLANRFASMGSGGALGSTGFRNQLAREGSNLSTNLAALRTGLQQQGVNQGLQYAQAPTSNYLQMLQQALTPTQNVYQPATNPWAGISSAFASGAAQGYGQRWGQGMVPGQSPSTA